MSFDDPFTSNSKSNQSLNLQQSKFQLNSLPSNSASSNISNEELKSHLQSLLQQKELEINNTGKLGETLLNKRLELNKFLSLIDNLNSVGIDDVGSNGDEADKENQLKNFTVELNNWELDNRNIFYEFNNVNNSNYSHDSSDTSTILPSLHSTSSFALSTAANSPQPFAVPTAPAQKSQSSRRSRNAAHRSDDMEFAAEIGQHLLIEVRRLQSLLTEKDDQIRKLQLDHDNKSSIHDDYLLRLSNLEQSVERYKEDNWNLEMQNQEVQQLNNQFQDQLTKIESEKNKLIKTVQISKDSIDEKRQDFEKLNNDFESLKQKFETETALARKDRATFSREKSDLINVIDNSKREIERLEKENKLKNNKLKSKELDSNNSIHHINDNELSRRLFLEGDFDPDRSDFGHPNEYNNQQGLLDEMFNDGDFTSRRRTTGNFPLPMLDSPRSVRVNTNEMNMTPGGARTANALASENETLRVTNSNRERVILGLQRQLRNEKAHVIDFKRKLALATKGTTDDVEDSDESDDDDDDDDEIEEVVIEESPTKLPNRLKSHKSQRMKSSSKLRKVHSVDQQSESEVSFSIL